MKKNESACRRKKIKITLSIVFFNGERARESETFFCFSDAARSVAGGAPPSPPRGRRGAAARGGGGEGDEFVGEIRGVVGEEVGDDDLDDLFDLDSRQRHCC